MCYKKNNILFYFIFKKKSFFNFCEKKFLICDWIEKNILILFNWKSFQRFFSYKIQQIYFCYVFFYIWDVHKYIYRRIS